ncbi:uncharacterized protein LOC119743229 isoform X2 [Patiria miniata]|uniref:Uncharacterized protein n=1 Tax=Patiria miniata TaxID=46514 RepID=A0A914BHH9_PATMI|nr:uncharacterized protein LOC119743229 isoform X2 [Patiria miniata]
MASQHQSRRSVRGGPPAAPSRQWSTVGQPTGKANYRPMTGMSRRPSRQQLQKPARQDSIPEAERNESTPDQNEQPVQPLPNSKKRYSYGQPSDPRVAAEMAVLTEYVKEKSLMSTMMTCCQAVLQRESLPYNPYPVFVSWMRREAERFHMFAKSTKSIQATLTSKQQSTTTPHIYGVKGHSNAWGLEAVINAVDPQALKRYDWLVEDETPTKLVLSDEQQEYSGQILVAMVGPAAFTGTMYRKAPSIDIRVEYVIYGPDLPTALLIFNSCISEDIRRHISADCPHRILGIVVPRSQPNENELWTVEQAREKWDDFWDTVRDSVLQKRPIVLQCMFLLDEETAEYRIGNKQFILHFVETSENSQQERFRSFAELPYLTLYEGIFLRKAHAETYVMTLKRLQETTNQSGANANGHRESMEDSLASLHEAERDDGSDLVNADEVREPIRAKWQRQIAKCHPVRDALILAHLTFLLALSDRSVQGSEVRIELYRFLHSTAASWYAATVLNSALQVLVTTIDQENEDDGKFLTQQFLEYKTKLLTAINPELHARSSEMYILHRNLGNVLQNMLIPDPSDASKVVLKALDLNTLQQIQNACLSLQLLLTEDAMFFFKRLNFKTLVRGCREAFNMNAAKAADAGKKKPQVKSTKSSNSLTAQTSSPAKMNHGVEVKEITQQKNIVIDVEEVKSFSNWPRIMVTEAVLMQYMVDIKLDQVWHEYLLELLTGDHLPPNPYPRLVTVLRQAAHRMQLCAETNASLSTKLLRPDQTKLVDRINSIHGVTSVGAYGLSPRTLAGLDAEPSGFIKIAKLMEGLTNKEVVARRGQFQIEVSLAVGRGCAFYGRLVPYLITLHLYEHYYIRGNIGADSDAIQLYAKLLYDNISSLSAQNHHILLGVFFGGGSRYMSEADLVDDKATFFSHVVDAARKKEDIHLKIYQPIGWRYLRIHKHFVLHYLFVDNTEDRHECYSPDDPSSVCQSVFLSQAQASAHARGGGAKQLGNLESATNLRGVNEYLSKEIEGALDGHQVMPAYQHILCKALVNKDKKLIADAWRALHSLAYQLDYIQAINQDLQDLVRYALLFPGKLIKASASSQSLAKGRGNKAKGEAGPSSQGPFNDAALAKFASVYSEKLTSVLQEPCAFVPSSLLQVIQDKLQTIVDVDNQTNRQSLPIEQETISTLKEIWQLIHPVQDWTSFDVHKALSHHDSKDIDSK